MVKTLLSHTRQIDQFIRRKLVEGLSISIPADRDAIITSFLETHQTDTKGGMTPETMAFFLQALNTHGLHEQLDNTKFTVVFPTYIPFEVEEVAAAHGFPSLYKTLEQNLLIRSASGKNTESKDKAASLATESYEVFEKVASITTREVSDSFKEQHDITRASKKSEAHFKAAGLYWKTSNMDEFIDSGVSDPRYLSAIESVKTSAMCGLKDKKATVSDFRQFLSHISDIVKYSK